MTGIKEKVTDTIDKLTHLSGKHETADTGAGTGGGLSSTTPTTTTGYETTATDTTPITTTEGRTGGVTSGGGLGAETGTTGLTTGTTGAATGGQDTYVSTTAGGTAGGGGLATGVTGGTSLGTTTQVGEGGEVVNRETFTKTTDQQRLLERRQYELEHRPVQQEYVVETKYVGDQALPGSTENVGSETREVEHATKEAPRQDATLYVENVDAVPGTTTTTTSGATGTPSTGI